MASSGWQSETLIYGPIDGINIIGNIRIDGITHSGSDLRVWGTIAVGARRQYGSATGVYFNAGIYAAAVNQSDAQILGNYEYLMTSQDQYRNFDVTISNVSSASTSYSFSVRYHSEYFDRTLSWTIYFDQSGTSPTGLTASLVAVGEDWAMMNVSIDSYGSPSTSANRYIEAAVLGSSTYGNPYRYAKSMETTSAMIIVPGSPGGGSLIITPNTQYYYGGCATNTVQSASTVTGTFVTLPAEPSLTAVDQGHGQIDFTVSHGNEGSAKTVTEEYSTDGGSTWTTITGGTFTLTLVAQTVVTVRRISDAGESVETVTVTPTFTNGIYASVSGQSERVEHVYAPVEGRKLTSASIPTPGTYLLGISDVNRFCEVINQYQGRIQKLNAGYNLVGIRVYEEVNWETNFRTWKCVAILENDGVQEESYIYSTYSLDVSRFRSTLYYSFGINLSSSWNRDDETVAISSTYGSLGSTVVKKVDKIYASVEGKSTLVFEDPS